MIMDIVTMARHDCNVCGHSRHLHDEHGYCWECEDNGSECRDHIS